MAGQHEDRGVRAVDQISVWDLISRVADEGNAIRLALWPNRVVPSATSSAEWPTGELPRVNELADAESDSDTDCQPPASQDEDPDELWGNRGPRPYQVHESRSSDNSVAG